MYHNNLLCYYTVAHLLEVEKREHQDLRNTWQANTDQILESQRLMMMDMRNVESLLTEEQQRQLEGQLILINNNL